MKDANKSDRRLAWIRLAGLVVVLIAVGSVATVWGTSSVQETLERFADSGWRGAVAFILVYAIATGLLVPGSATTVTAGLVYGTTVGAAVALVGATLGATIAYAIARGVGRRPAEALFGRQAAAADGWIADHQFRSIVVLRLLPIVPFSVFNYAAGLSAVRPLPYVAGTALGSIPGALLIAGLGSTARQPTSPAFLALVAAAVVFVVGSGFVARRITRR